MQTAVIAVWSDRTCKEDVRMDPELPTSRANPCHHIFGQILFGQFAFVYFINSGHDRYTLNELLL
jgi:hypothetical protein